MVVQVVHCTTLRGHRLCRRDGESGDAEEPNPVSGEPTENLGDQQFKTILLLRPGD